MGKTWERNHGPPSKSGQGATQEVSGSGAAKGHDGDGVFSGEWVTLGVSIFPYFPKKWGAS